MSETTNINKKSERLKRYEKIRKRRNARLPPAIEIKIHRTSNLISSQKISPQKDEATHHNTNNNMRQ